MTELREKKTRTHKKN